MTSQFTSLKAKKYIYQFQIYTTLSSALFCPANILAWLIYILYTLTPPSCGLQWPTASQMIRKRSAAQSTAVQLLPCLLRFNKGLKHLRCLLVEYDPRYPNSPLV